LGSKPKNTTLATGSTLLKARISLTLEGKIGDLEALVGALGGRNDRGVADQGVVNARIGDQVGLELVEINVKCAVESQGRGDRGNNLGDQAVEVLVAGPGDVQVPPADIVDSLVVDQECTVRVLNGAVGGENGVVRLNDGSGNPGSRVHGELELAFLAVVGRKALKEESTKAGTGTTAKGVEDQETLEGVAVVFIQLAKQ